MNFAAYGEPAAAVAGALSLLQPEALAVLEDMQSLTLEGNSLSATFARRGHFDGLRIKAFLDICVDIAAAGAAPK